MDRIRILAMFVMVMQFIHHQQLFGVSSSTAIFKIKRNRKVSIIGQHLLGSGALPKFTETGYN